MTDDNVDLLQLMEKQCLFFVRQTMPYPYFLLNSLTMNNSASHMFAMANYCKGYSERLLSAL